MIPTVGPFLLPRVLPLLREAAPRLKIYLREEQTAPLLERLERGEIDAAILALPVALGNVETDDLALDRFFVVCSPAHRLARMPAASPHDMATEDLLLLEDGHCLRDHALAACALEGARRNVAFQGTSLQTLVMMAANGLGLTLVPEMAVAAGMLRGLDLHATPLEGDSPARRIALAWRRGAERKETVPPHRRRAPSGHGFPRENRERAERRGPRFVLTDLGAGIILAEGQHGGFRWLCVTLTWTRWKRRS